MIQRSFAILEVFSRPLDRNQENVAGRDLNEDVDPGIGGGRTRRDRRSLFSVNAKARDELRADLIAFACYCR